MTPNQKAQFMESSKFHFENGMLQKSQKGITFDGLKGCTIGCHANDIAPYLDQRDRKNGFAIDKIVADYYGLPEWFVRLHSKIYYGLCFGAEEELVQAKLWHISLPDAVPVNADWNLLFHEVHAEILYIVCRYAGKYADLLEGVIRLHEISAQGKIISDDDWATVELTAEVQAGGGIFEPNLKGAIANCICSSAVYRSSIKQNENFERVPEVGWYVANDTAKYVESAARLAFSTAETVAKYAMYKEFNSRLKSGIAREEALEAIKPIFHSKFKNAWPEISQIVLNLLQKHN